LTIFGKKNGSEIWGQGSQRDRFWSQSYDLWIYDYIQRQRRNSLERFLKWRKIYLFSRCTRLLAALAL
jgi:hypothetical protein